MSKALRALVVASASVLAFAGCGSASGTPATNSPAAPATLKVTAAAQLTSTVLWMGIGDLDRAVYVVRVANTGAGTSAVASLTGTLLDSSGAAVGSNDVLVPALSAGGHVDIVTGTTPFDAVTGQPATVQIAIASRPDAPVIHHLTSGTPLRQTPHEYDSPGDVTYRIRVTNTTGALLIKGVDTVTQQIIGYATSGKIITADWGMTDNVPPRLATGATYIEEWNCHSPMGKAATVGYDAWVTMSSSGS